MQSFLLINPKTSAYSNHNAWTIHWEETVYMHDCDFHWLLLFNQFRLHVLLIGFFELNFLLHRFENDTILFSPNNNYSWTIENWFLSAIFRNSSNYHYYVTIYSKNIAVLSEPTSLKATLRLNLSKSIESLCCFDVSCFTFRRLNVSPTWWCCERTRM